jgi:hypothetical protein
MLPHSIQDSRALWGAFGFLAYMYLPTALGLAAIFLASPALGFNSLWEHNGSTVFLTAEGSNREFHYAKPRPGMLRAGAHPGSLLFSGKAVDGKYVGTAYIFNPYCGAIPYEVNGSILDNYRRVVLRGHAPSLDSDCNIVGHVPETLEFSYLKIAKITPNTFHYSCKSSSDSRYALTVNTNRGIVKLVELGGARTLKTFRILEEATIDVCAKHGWILNGATFCAATQGVADLSWQGHDYFDCDQVDME